MIVELIPAVRKLLACRRVLESMLQQLELGQKIKRKSVDPKHKRLAGRMFNIVFEYNEYVENNDIKSEFVKSAQKKIALFIFYRNFEKTVLFDHKNYTTISDFFFTKVIVKWHF